MTPDRMNPKRSGSFMAQRRAISLDIFNAHASSDEDAEMWEHLQRLGSLDYDSSPFTQTEQRVFDIARDADKHATFVLKAFFVPVCLLSFVPMLAFIVLPSSLNTIATIASISSFLVLLQQILSYYATGWGPHKASQAANMAQDTLAVIGKRFFEMGEMLVEAFFSPDPQLAARAVSAARQIRVDVLRARVAQCSFSGGSHIVDPLEDGIVFVRNAARTEASETEGDSTAVVTATGKWSFHTVTIRHLCDSLLAKQELERLRERMARMEVIGKITL